MENKSGWTRATGVSQHHFLIRPTWFPRCCSSRCASLTSLQTSYSTKNKKNRTVRLNGGRKGAREPRTTLPCWFFCGFHRNIGKTLVLFDQKSSLDIPQGYNVEFLWIVPPFDQKSRSTPDLVCLWTGRCLSSTGLDLLLAPSSNNLVEFIDCWSHPTLTKVALSLVYVCRLLNFPQRRWAA